VQVGELTGGGCLRKTWKAVGLGLVNLLLVVGTIAAVQPLLRKYTGAGGEAVLVALCVGVYIAACKWIERRAPTELTVGRAPVELVSGILLGLALFSSVMTILWIAGAYQPAGWGSYRQLAGGLLFAVLSAVIEELLFRGLLFRLSSKILGTWGALLVTSTLFGAAHAANPGATVSSSLAIALEAGILLGAAYAATGRLWLPIGLHLGWNFTEGSLFGMTLSGNAMGSGLVRGSLNGPQILTGGEFGPEASIVAVILCLRLAAYFIRRVIKFNRVEPPVWRQARPAPAPGEIPV
jgi:membrane protease YdiL (CAAX protease family)